MKHIVVHPPHLTHSELVAVSLSPQGFFVPYLAGGVSLVVLAVGSTAPGLLNFFTDKFQTLFPDFRDRVLRHEAGHFLVPTQPPDLLEP